MKRVKRLDDGRLLVDDKVYDDFQQLPEPIRENYALLSACDGAVSVHNVGHRMLEGVFWIFEKDEK